MVSKVEEHLIGILTDRFSPEKDDEEYLAEGPSLPDFETNFSYDVSIEYGLALLEKEDQEII